MRHLKSGRKLKRTSSHRRALMKNMATALFEHKKISTTEAKAKELRPYAEALITKAKRALVKEQQGLLPEGQTVDIHNRRVVGRYIENKAVLQELFDTIAPMVLDRQGGYTRIIKTGVRRGDASRTAIIELVDWSAPVDGNTSLKPKKKSKAKAKGGVKQVTSPKAKKAEAAEETHLEPIVEDEVITAPIVEEVPVVEIPEKVIAPVAETATEAEVIAEVAAPVAEEPVIEAPADEEKTDETPSDEAAPKA